MKTRDEIEQLKASWRADPAWDLFESEGFEEYAEELRAYQEECQRERARRAEEETFARGKTMGVDNLPLIRYLVRLEGRVEKLEEEKVILLDCICLLELDIKSLNRRLNFVEDGR